MASAFDYVEFFYPHLLDEADPRYVPLADLDMALAIAEPFRPPCNLLTDEQKSQAVAHYAAYVLLFRVYNAASSSSSTGSGSSESSSVSVGAVIEKTEGDTTIRWAPPSSSSSASVSMSAKNANSGPSVPYAAWERLWLVCSPLPGAENGAGGGGATVDPPPRRGGLITRFGLPK